MQRERERERERERSLPSMVQVTQCHIHVMLTCPCGGRTTTYWQHASSVVRDKLFCHILNNCKVALNLRRYNNRHDEILRTISSFVQKQVPDDVTVLTDLPNGDQYQFPSSLTLTDLHPDLVAYSNLTKSVTMVELTVCYETNFKDAQSRKEEKYMELVEEIEQKGFVVDLITVEVGSRGFINQDSFYHLNGTLGATKRELMGLMLSVSEAAIRGSFEIWIGRNTTNIN